MTIGGIKELGWAKRYTQPSVLTLQEENLFNVTY